jgi:hypothetical protein
VCKSHYLSQLAAFFIEVIAEGSIVKSCISFCFLVKFEPEFGHIIILTELHFGIDRPEACLRAFVGERHGIAALSY